MRRKRLVAELAVLVCLASWPVLAGDLPQVHALTGVRIVVAPGQEIESGTVVLRDGVIEAVGADVESPADARVWELKGSTVYPGLIEPYAVRPWPTEDEEDGEDAPQGGHENSVVKPERDMTLHAYDEAGFKKLRAAGYTSAVFAPDDGLFRGRSVLMNLGEGGLAGNLLLRDVAHNVTLATHPDGEYPNSLMGAVALARQTFYDARWYGDAHLAYEANPRQERPPFSIALAELVAAARGRAPVLFESQDVLDTLRIAAIAGELELDAAVVGHGEEYKRLDAVAATGLTHLLPLAFPEPPDMSDEDPLTVGLEELRHWDLAPENPARLVAAGVEVAFTSHELTEPKLISARLAIAIERGLTPEQALAGVTTVPAKILGVDERMGTVEAGKMANLLIVEGDLFTEKPKLREVWVDGRRFELKDVKPPEINPAGTWDLIISAGDQRMPMSMELVGTMEDLSGSISTPAGKLPFSSVEVSGKKVEVTFDGASLGMPGTFTFTMSVKGDTARGAGTGPPGSFTFKGKRTSKPEVER